MVAYAVNEGYTHDKLYKLAADAGIGFIEFCQWANLAVHQNFSSLVFSRNKVNPLRPGGNKGHAYLTKAAGLVKHHLLKVKALKNFITP